MDKNVFKYVLLEQLVKHFDIESVTELPIPGTNRFQLHENLVEKNVLPAGYDPSEWESKGFEEPKKVQDFAFLADGAKLTANLAAFLKGAGR